MRTIILAAAAATLLFSPLCAQNYSGVGGRFEQNLLAHQVNLALPAAGNVNVPFAGNNRRIFVRWLSPSSLSVSGFDIRMRFGALGEVVPAWLYSANAQNRPGQVLTEGEVGIRTSMRTCRASLRDRIQVQANTLYFVAFRLPAGENVRFETTSGGPSSPVTYFVTPSGPAQQANIRFGINTGGFSPKIALQQPVRGSNYNVDLTKGSIGSPAALWFQLISPGLPTNLAPFGANGSFLYLDLGNMLLAGVVPGEPDRTRRMTLFMPDLPSLIGTPLAYQWQVATNTIPAGWVTSDLALAVLQ